MTDITRKGFLGAAAGGTVLLFLQACGGGGGDYSSAPAPAPTPPPPPPAPAPPGQCTPASAVISGNHGHVLAIPAADLDSTTDKSYSIHGTATHDHTVTFTVGLLQMLKNGQTVMATSTETNSHSHSVSVSCV